MFRKAVCEAGLFLFQPGIGATQVLVFWGLFKGSCTRDLRNARFGVNLDCHTFTKVIPITPSLLKSNN